MALRAGVKFFLTDLGICLPSSPPFGACSSVAEYGYNEMIDTRGVIIFYIFYIIFIELW